jgi:hypothetical protein
MNEVIHEMGDFDVDKQTEINNTVQRFEGFDLTKLLFAMLATVVIGCSIIVFTIPQEYRMISLSISLFFGVPMFYKMNARVSRIVQAR